MTSVAVEPCDSGSLIAAWELHKRWPGRQLVVVDHECHGGKCRGGPGCTNLLAEMTRP